MKSPGKPNLTVAPHGMHAGDDLAPTRRQMLRALASSTALGALAACTRGASTEQPATALARPAKIAVSYPVGPADQLALYQAIPKRAHEKYPSLEIEEVALPGNQLNEKMLALIAAGTPADVMHIAQVGVGSTEDLATRGALLKLDARVKSDKAFKWDDFWPAAHTVGQYQGAQVALPGSPGLSAALMYFNKDVFTASGRPTPDQLLQRQQWTWDTLLNEAANLTKRQSTGELVQAGIGYPWFEDVWTTLLVRCYGGDYMDPQGTKVLLNSSQAIQGLRVAGDLSSRRRAMPQRGEGDSMKLAIAGQVAQAVYWTAAASWWRQTSFDWDVAPTPAGPAARATAGKLGHIAIPQGSTQQDAAWHYATFALSPEVNLEQAVGFGNMVLRQSIVPAWRQRMAPQKPRNLNLVEEAVKALKVDPLRTVNAKQADVDKVYIREIQALLYDGKPAEQVAATVATEGNALLGVK